MRGEVGLSSDSRGKGDSSWLFLFKRKQNRAQSGRAGVMSGLEIGLQAWPVPSRSGRSRCPCISARTAAVAPSCSPPTSLRLSLGLHRGSASSLVIPHSGSNTTPVAVAEWAKGPL